VYLLTLTGLIACTDARLFDASSCPSIPLLTFYKLLEIERSQLAPAHGCRQITLVQLKNTNLSWFLLLV
jgi:hypothetical protein